MSSNDFTPASLVAIVGKAQRDKAAADAEVAKLREEASVSRAAVEERARAADQAGREAAARTSATFTAMLRDLTGAVRTARATAVEAVRSGEGDVLALWLMYHKTRAANQARWLAIRYEAQQATGQMPPPGEFGLPAYDPTGADEDFGAFLSHAVYEVTNGIAEATRTEVNAELDAARVAAEATPEPRKPRGR